MSTHAQKITMREGLPEVFARFSATAEAQPERLFTTRAGERAALLGVPVENDPFGQLAAAAHELFMDETDTYVHEKVPNIDVGGGRKLLEGMHLANLGIGTIALFSELAPLVQMRTEPEREISPEEAALTASNSFGFIEKIIENGSRPAINIVSSTIMSHENVEGTWRFQGTIVDGILLHPARLRKFHLISEPADHARRIEPIELDRSIEEWRSQASERVLAVTCPAHILEKESSGLPFTRELFDVMLNHVRQHIYPDYIPMARGLILADDANS